MILITGTTGILGAHFCVSLLNKGDKVRALYRSEERKKYVEFLLNLYFPEKAVLLSSQIEWYKGDVLDLDEVKEMCAGVSKIIHCAAFVSFDRRDFRKLIEINRIGTANLVNQALLNNIPRFIHISSTSAVGSENPKGILVKTEENQWAANEVSSAYGLSKYLGEKEVWRGQKEGLSSLIVNPSVLIAPGSWDESSLKIFRTVSNGLKYYTKGANSFVDVRDVVEATIRMDELDIENNRFLLTGNNTSFKSLFDCIAKETNAKAPKKLAGKFLTELAWRLDRFKSFFTRKTPTLTKDSARASQTIIEYSSQKALDKFPDFSFRKLEESVQFAVKNRYSSK